MSDHYTDALKATRASFVKEWEGKLYVPDHVQKSLDDMDKLIAARLIPKHKIVASHVESKIHSAFKTMKLTCNLTVDQQKRINKILNELKEEL